MSTDKLKVLKKIKGVDSYSKNPIIDSMIKHKLQSQMIIVKENFNDLIKKQQSKQKEAQSLEKNKLKKRRLSMHNLATLTSQRIRDSINYNPTIEKQVVNFVISRQRDSPFFTKEQIQNVNKARLNGDDFFIKMRMKDKLNYAEIGNNLTEPQLQNADLTNKIKKMIPLDVWLPTQPQVSQLLNSKFDKLEFSPKQNNNPKFYISQRPVSQSFVPLQNSRSKITVLTQINQITYQPKKYHKNDYLSLQNWLQTAVQFINKSTSQAKESSNSVSQKQYAGHLNKTYTVYMCALKELIRLTYIQSAEKGLLLQKLIWSLTRLFQQLIAEQHKINYQQFKIFTKDKKQMKDIYQQRIQKLQKIDLLRSQLIKDLQITKGNIGLSCLSFKKVNEEMNLQIQDLMKKIKSFQTENSYLMSNLLKMVRQFQEKDIIKVQKTNDYNIYFYLNSQNKVEVVTKVPRNDILQRYFTKELKDAASRKHSITDFEGKVKNKLDQTNGIDRLQNQLTQYWSKKEDYLQINRLIKQNFDRSIVDYGCQAEGNGPLGVKSIHIQFPEQKVETFEQFLKKQLDSERDEWIKKEDSYKQITISLKELYQQAHDTINVLNNQIILNKQVIQQKNSSVSYLQMKIQQMQDKVNLLTKKIVLLQRQIESKKLQQQKLKIEIESGTSKLGQQKKRYYFQKQNNNILVIENLKLKEKEDFLNKKFENLQDKIKLLAPHMQQMMILAENSENAILQKLTELIQKHLSEYVERDAKVFLTR